MASNADGVKTVRVSDEEAIHRLGEMPLPPYIHRRLEEPERYQTVYARPMGSAAAPTAGLHFTRPILQRLEEAGVEMVFLTLHVGLDTFRPVKAKDPRKHKIHTEYYELDDEAAGTLDRARREGRRIIAVGTTSVAGAGTGGPKFTARGARRPESGPRTGRPVHPARTPVPDGRCPGHQLPPAPVHSADAGVRLGWAGAGAGGI